MRPTQSQASVRLYLDKRSTKGKNKEHPIKIRVTYNRDTRYLNTAYTLSPTDYEKLSSDRVYGDLRDIKIALHGELARANEVIGQMKSFNFTQFKKNMGLTANSRSISWYFEYYIAKVMDEERIGTANAYNTALNNFKKFFGSKFSFHHLTHVELLNFENAFVAQGKSTTTVGIYMRCLRAMYNLALEEGTIARSDYPFGRNRYLIPTTKKRKIGIAKTFIKEIHDYTFEKPVDNFYKDLWLFSFHCNGMNMKDIAFLKYENMQNSVITFVRKKTRLTKKGEQNEIYIQLNRNARDIIARWGNSNQKKDTYIFPILEEEMDLKRKQAVYVQVTHMATETVKRVATAKDWPFTPTFITARHSFGNLLQNSDQPLHVIQRALGHSDPKTTEHYLSHLHEEKLNEISSLTEF